MVNFIYTISWDPNVELNNILAKHVEQHILYEFSLPSTSYNYTSVLFPTYDELPIFIFFDNTIANFNTSLRIFFAQALLFSVPNASAAYSSTQKRVVCEIHTTRTQHFI